MKTLTLRQPWASLVTWGEKKYETRTWRTDYRGPLAIHASLLFKAEHREMYIPQPFANLLKRHGITDPSSLRSGCILCVVDLVNVMKTEECMSQHPIDYQELSLGDWYQKHFAWELQNIRVLADPIQVMGHQGLWEWPVELESLEFMK